MKPIGIMQVLDLAVEARRNGDIYNPLFIGEAGLGKSQIIQQWVKKKKEENPNFIFIDMRLTYYEAPDIIGFPKEFEDENGMWRTMNALPDYWPVDGEGLVLFEEPNTANSSVTNTLMQLLTDRKLGNNYTLPEGVILAGAMNPDTAEYDTHSMSAALADRFEPFNIEYDHNSFVAHIEEAKWSDEVVRYIKSGQWIYQPSNKISDDGVYISPRTLSKVNNAIKAGAMDRGADFHRETCISSLGKFIGNEFWKTCWNDAPITAQDILNNKKSALATLKKQCKHDKNSTYQGDKITMTCESIVTNYGGRSDEDVQECGPGLIDEQTMAEVCAIIPKDQAINLIKDCGYKVSGGDITRFFNEFIKRHEKLMKSLRANIRVNRAN